MASPPTRPVETLRDYTELIEELMTAADAPLWYRGCGQADYPLIPSLYRHPSITEVADLVSLEAEVLARFKQRGLPYLSRVPVDDWDYLFLMQHVGVPTRLLDWTENPYIGLFFAITAAEAHCDPETGAFTTPAAVWVLDPTIWNRKALSHVSFEGGVLSVSDGQLSGYAPTSSLDFMNNEPVALYGLHNSPRIVAQRGVFTIFGKNKEPMSTMYDQLEFPEDSLLRIDLPVDALPALRKSIFAIGYTESVIYPDLDGLARELKRHFKFTP
jgi:hypothetical protein